MSANNMQPHPEQPDDMGLNGGVQRDFNDILLNGTPDELATLPELTEDDFAAIEAIANGEDIRNEDAGRVYDIEAAYEEAKAEDKQHTLALKRDAEQEEHDQQEEKEEPEGQPQQTTEEEVVSRAATVAVRALQTAAAHESARTQAQAAMRSAGGLGFIPPQAHVTKDPFSNTFTVENGAHVQIIRPRAVGSRYEVTDYRYNEKDHTLRISIRGHSSLTRPTGQFSAETTNAPAGVAAEAGQEVHPQELGEAITLPGVVARIVGEPRVARVLAHS